MALSSLQLEAFHEVARTLHFSRAARNLRVTQSALSQRVLNLESELGVTLLVRGPAGVRLTDAGTRLLRHCQVRASLESELLAELLGRAPGEAAGVLRIGGFSSVMRSVVLPALADWLARNPDVQIEIHCREMRELAPLLLRGEIDYAILDHDIDRGSLETHLLGRERQVLVEPLKPGAREEVYLDHDPEDPTTERFLRRQGRKVARLRRSFMDDVYGILDGVELGLGKAVLPLHLLKGRRNLRMVRGLKAYETPVVLHYLSQPYYSRLHQEVVATLLRECPKFL